MDKKISPNLARGRLIRKKSHTALRYWGKIVLSLAVTLIVIFGALSLKVVSSVSSRDVNGEKISLFQQLSHLLTKKNNEIKGETEDRINVLLLGMGGEGHQGALLTDTIILASIKPSTKQVAMLSIPRDLVVDIPGQDYRKINNALYFGQQMDYPGGGEALSVKMVSDVTGLDIQYYGRVDFDGFKQVIDGLGGVKVNVEKSFSDYTYPTLDYGYQTVTFRAGEQTMDGETALKYVRSRHGNNGEGSDFARAKRQQKVLLALKEKMTAFSTLVSPKKISEILTTLGDHTKTDMEIWEMLKIYSLLQNASEENIINEVLDNSADGLLKTEVGIDGAYILVPKAGNYSEIQSLAKNIFDQNYIEQENARIAVMNGTSKSNLAKDQAIMLEERNFNIIDYGNYQDKDVKKTLIYDRTNGKLPYTLQALKDKYDAIVYSDAPLFFSTLESDQQININSLSIKEELNLNKSVTNYDLILVLGEDIVAKASLDYQ